MKSAKKYSNQTFTKRVDHEGGSHRESQAFADGTRCRACHATFAGGRWTTRPHRPSQLTGAAQPPPAEVVCPACIQIESGVVGGYLTISGSFRNDHRDEIDNLIQNEAASAAEDNPLSRIMRTLEEGERVVIETTTEHLAQRLGRSLSSAYAGEVKYDFSHENKVARVGWHRD
jgi:NMD protein affecting ribosome stability and mRNA decay